MVSEGYQTKGQAKAAAKAFAEETGIKRVSLYLDLEQRQYHFASGGDGTEKLFEFASYEKVKGKWVEREPRKKKGRVANE